MRFRSSVTQQNVSIHFSPLSLPTYASDNNIAMLRANKKRGTHSISFSIDEAITCAINHSNSRNNVNITASVALPTTGL
jgi:hypothetical protein